MKDILIKIGLIAVIVLLVFFLIGERSNNSRLDRNIQSFMQAGAKELVLTRKEFKEYGKIQKDSLYLFLLDSLKIKNKNVTSTITYYYHHTFDSTFTVLTTPPNSIYREFTKEWENCFKVSGRVNNDTLFWDLPEITVASTTAYYWLRQNADGKRRPWPWKKRIFSATKNLCTGQSEVVKIEVDKR